MYILRQPQYLDLGTPLDLATSATHELLLLMDVDCVGFEAICTDQSVSATNIVIDFTYRPVAGSSTAGDVALGSLSFAAGAVAGSVIKHYIQGVACNVGGSIYIAVSTAADTSGHAFVYPLTQDNPQSDLAQANVIVV